MTVNNGLVDEARDSILAKAFAVTSTERGRDYGHPLDNHAVTGGLWSAYLGLEVTPEDVCFMNILQKISRTVAGKVLTDTLVDIAGYARNIEMMQEERDRRDHEADKCL